MNTKRQFGYVVLLLLLISAGCAHRHTSERVGLSNLKTADWPYQSKPERRTDTGGMFYWFVSADRKTIGYEPCAGLYTIAMLEESSSNLVFAIEESHGIPIDLMSGRTLAQSNMIGKKYEAKLEGAQITSVSEVQ